MTSNHSFNPNGINPKAQDVVKDEIVKLLDFGLIYPISDSLWVSLIHVVPKKGGMTLVLNDNNELIPSRTVTGWRVLFQILIAPEDQEKTTFPCPYGTFAYKRMSFGLCNAPSTFQRCMTAIFHDMVKDFMEVFMDDLLSRLAFNILKEKLTTTPIIISLDWNVPFELMCDASDFAVGAVLGQRIDGKFKPIYYASKTLNNAQEHYTTTEKELLAVVFSFDKFRPYLILSKTVVYTNHYALKYLFSKQDAKPRLIRWIMLLQGFDIEIKDKKGAENLAANHLSRLKKPDLGVFTKAEIADEFPNEHLMILKAKLNDDEPCRDYVSKWVEAQALPMNDVRVVVKFLRGLFARFRVPKSLISNRGTYFCNSLLEKALQKYGVIHKLSTAYHPQTNGQTEVTNRAIRRILESSVGYNPKDWSEKLNNALWAFRTAYKMPKRCTPFRLVYDKAYWALKQGNMKLRDRAYENTRISKERTKKWHDSRLRGDKYFKVGYKVLLFNSRLRMHPGKLKSKWYGPNVVKTVYRMGQWKSPIKMKLVIRSMEKDLRSTTMDILIGNIKRSSNLKKIRHKA
ncbi:reverse transcriptase domain-containing protein [Tanacetum coccineum]